MTDVKKEIINIKGSILNIEIYENKNLINFGSGTLVNGFLLANRHLIEQVYKNDKYSVLIKNKDNSYASSIKLGPCGKGDGIDLCLLKVDIESRFKFILNTKRPGVGWNVFTLGLCSGKEFFMENNKIIKTVDDFHSIDNGGFNKNIPVLITTTKECLHGASGGAVLDSTGELIGIITGGIIKKNNEVDNYSISASALKKFILSNRDKNFKNLDKTRIIKNGEITGFEIFNN